MAVTAETSAEYKNITDPRANGFMTPEVTAQKNLIQRFNFTQGAAAGDITSTQKLWRAPAGRIILFPKLSFLQWSAFGAARTLDVGYAAYTDEDAAAVIAATTAFDNAINVAAAGAANLGSSIAAGTGGVFDFKTDQGFDVLCTVAGGTIPAAATLKGYLVYAMVGS